MMNTYEKNGNVTAWEVSNLQTSRFVAKDKILDLTDLLAFDPKRGKTAFTLVEFIVPAVSWRTLARQWDMIAVIALMLTSGTYSVYALLFLTCP